MWDVVGHSSALHLLGKSLAANALVGAYLFVGPTHVGKGTLAKELAKAVNCGNTEEHASGPCNACRQCDRIGKGIHADVVTLEVQEEAGRKAIGIEQVREAQRQASLRPFEGQNRVLIFDRADALTIEASNALLKTLEEPPSNVILILLTDNESGLLSTVRSRCQRLQLHPLTETEVATALEKHWGASPEAVRNLARLCRGCIGWGVRALEEPSVLENRTQMVDRVSVLASASLETRFAYANELAVLFPRSRSSVFSVLEEWATWWRDLLLVSHGLQEAILNLEHGPLLEEQATCYSVVQLMNNLYTILHTAELLKQNVSPRLALENLMLSLQSTEAQ